MIETETDLAGRLIKWLEEMGWDIYQEVSMGTGGRRADIVAVIKPKIWIIEVKRNYGIKVLDQAFWWRTFAHYVSVAVPLIGRMRTIDIIHESLGLGLICIGNYSVEEMISPQMNRHAKIKRIRLSDEHKRFAKAGSNSGGYFSSFALTKQQLCKVVRDNPGLTMKEIITRLGVCHYASTKTAGTALAKWIRKGVIDGVERRRLGKAMHYYPVEKQSVKSVVKD